MKVKVLAAQSCLSLLWPHELWPTSFLCPWDSPSKENGMGSILQGIFLTKGSNPGPQHHRQILYHLSH